MTLAETNTEGNPQPAAPRWMLLMGCGCLVPGFLLVSAGAFFLQQIGGMRNQQRAWDELAELIEFDDALRGAPTGVLDNPKTPTDESRAPGEFVMQMGGSLPISEGGEAFYYIGRDVASPMEEPFVTGPNPLLVTIAKLPAEQSDAATSAPPGTPMHEEGTIRVGDVVLRKRTIPLLVTPERSIPFLFSVPERRGAGAAVWLRDDFKDSEDSEKLYDLVAYFQRPDSTNPIGDEEIRAFLAPFRIPGPEPKPAEGELPTPRGEERER